MAIRDQGYTRYEGDLTRGAPPALVIASTEFSIYWGYLRTKLLFVFSMIVPVLFLVATFGERIFVKMFASQMGGGADKINGAYEYAFGYAEIWMLWLILAASGCGVIADDMRHRTIQLYFSKPINRHDYILGKFLSLVFLGSLVTVIPFIIVGGVRFIVFIPSDGFKDVALNLLMLGLFNVIILLFFSLIVMALSCLTKRWGYAVLMWLGAIFVPTVVSTVAWSVVRLKEGMASGDEADAWTNLLSVVGSLGMILKKFVGYGGGLAEPGKLEMGPPPAEYLTWFPWLIVLAIAIGAGAIIHWRTSKLEGIA